MFHVVLTFDEPHARDVAVAPAEIAVIDADAGAVDEAERRENNWSPICLKLALKPHGSFG